MTAERPVRRRMSLLAAGVVVAAIWVLLIRLALAFWRSELGWTYVAEQSRIDAPWYYRVAGVWGGMEGSLLLFAGVVGLCGLLAAAPQPGRCMGGHRHERGAPRRRSRRGIAVRRGSTSPPSAGSGSRRSSSIRR